MFHDVSCLVCWRYLDRSMSQFQASAADNWLPLHFAAQNGHVEVVQVRGCQMLRRELLVLASMGGPKLPKAS